jgi:hypothetical protein
LYATFREEEKEEEEEGEEEEEEELAVHTALPRRMASSHFGERTRLVASTSALEGGGGEGEGEGGEGEGGEGG